jgi:hypothetical protein
MITKNAFRSLAMFALLLLVFSACQKENTLTSIEAPVNITPENGGAVTDRAPNFFGVTVWTSAIPSQIVEVDASTGLVVNAFNVTSNGTQIKDLKGICLGPGGYYVSTGVNNPLAFVNRLLMIDITTGFVVANYSTGVNFPVSDICFHDESPLGIYGLRDNSNTPVRINYNAGAWGTSTIFAAMALGQGQVASGLSWGKISGGYRIYIASRNTTSTNVRLHTWNPTTSTATFNTNLTPVADFTGANLGFGYFSFGPVAFINRRPTSAGLNKVNWPPAPATSLLGAVGTNFEDLCTILY